AQGIGRAIALRLAADGFSVALADLPAKMPLLEALVAQITAVKEGETPGAAAAAFGADVSEEGEVRALVEGCVERFGGLDVMVANAGVAGPRQARLVDLSADQWDTVMNTNARGTFLCYKYAGLQMIKQGRGGRIIGASSVAGKKAIATQAPYSASKFAIRGLTQAAALEFGSHGITVNAYAPGAIDTDMCAFSGGTSVREKSRPGRVAEERASYVVASVYERLGRTPEDVANLVSFIASKESQFITVREENGLLLMNCRFCAPTNDAWKFVISLYTWDSRGVHTHILSSPYPAATTISMSTQQRVALVTGAAQGIRLAADGFDVAVNDVASNADKLDELVEEIKNLGRASSKWVADVSQEEAVREMVEGAVRVQGGLDVVSALHTVAPSVVDSEWDRVMNINGRGPFLCYKYAGMQMLKQERGGRIIGASSVAGKRAIGTQPVYSASKFAVRGLTQAAALEFGPHGITVNAYAPGAVDTPMSMSTTPCRPSRGLGSCRSLSLDHSSQLNFITIPCSAPTDIASLVSFLASKESGFITGELFHHPFMYTFVVRVVLIRRMILRANCGFILVEPILRKNSPVRSNADLD
ncbi:NAD(P)-binding protein, partial [Mycena filopes]